jgi:hypothetical protein
VVQTPTDATKAQVWVSGSAPNQQLEFYIPRGAKGDPGGFNTGTALGSADLNTIVTPGLYRNWTSTDASAGNNYPPSAYLTQGPLEVISIAAPTDVIQRYTVIGGQINSAMRVSYIRRYFSGVWSAWYTFNSTRVDQTAGRAIYQWDDVNVREQLIYGDTGWRDVSASLINGWTGTLTVRRVMQTVTLNGTLYGGSRTSDHFIALASIAGFKPRGGVTCGMASNIANETIKMVGNDNTDLYITTGAATNYTVFCTYLVSEAIAWPTTLPGTASGAIPNT